MNENHEPSFTQNREVVAALEARIATLERQVLRLRDAVEELSAADEDGDFERMTQAEQIEYLRTLDVAGRSRFQDRFPQDLWPQVTREPPKRPEVPPRVVEGILDTESVRAV